MARASRADFILPDIMQSARLQPGRVCGFLGGFVLSVDDFSAAVGHEIAVVDAF